MTCTTDVTYHRNSRNTRRQIACGLVCHTVAAYTPADLALRNGAQYLKHGAGGHFHTDGVVLTPFKSDARLLATKTTASSGGQKHNIFFLHLGESNKDFAGRSIKRNVVDQAANLQREARGGYGSGAVLILKRELHNSLLIRERSGSSRHNVAGDIGDAHIGNGVIAIGRNVIKRPFLTRII